MSLEIQLKTSKAKRELIRALLEGSGNRSVVHWSQVCEEPPKLRAAYVVAENVNGKIERVGDIATHTRTINGLIQVGLLATSETGLGLASGIDKASIFELIEKIDTTVQITRQLLRALAAENGMKLSFQKKPQPTSAEAVSASETTARYVITACRIDTDDRAIINVQRLNDLTLDEWIEKIRTLWPVKEHR